MGGAWSGMNVDLGPGVVNYHSNSKTNATAGKAFHDQT
jgi:hypothetical protein